MVTRQYSPSSCRVRHKIKTLEAIKTWLPGFGGHVVGTEIHNLIPAEASNDHARQLGAFDWGTAGYSSFMPPPPAWGGACVRRVTACILRIGIALSLQIANLR